jgi:hypothetical protein
MTNNVIRFPGQHRSAPPQTVEEVQQRVETIRRDLADEAVGAGMIGLFEALANLGIDLTDPECHSHNALICESIRAAVYKSLTLNHDFHSMVDEMFDFEYLDEGVFSYIYKIPTGFTEREEQSS